jgi:hypothetical protein
MTNIRLLLIGHIQTIESVIIKNLNIMPKFVIEREIPGAGKLTSEQLKAITSIPVMY